MAPFFMMKRRTPCVPELHGQQTSSNSTARTTHIESSSQTRSSGQDRTIDICFYFRAVLV